MGFSLVNQFFAWVGINNIDFFNNPKNVSYALIVIALLLYFITFKMIMAPAEMVHLSQQKKYKTSGLNNEMIIEYKKQLIDYMEIEKGYMENTLSLGTLSDKLNIPKQYISEILNMHLNTNFQDFVNGYRVEAFTKKMGQSEYENLTLEGIAYEVGFNSKSNFYTAFKKAKGLTPSEYRKSISSN
ncbi:MAG: helix-turn-helix transcriptional regulator [Aequorivita sp.]|nr:helix-turn-helix transcriptional regulator [Aequorivita sp.]MCB0467588.1 helix-turn-helix transcriptional regulator [Aequorivita sp.]HPE82278.1 helix-turn-helix domain-containing protein [Aequorivita sp.]